MSPPELSAKTPASEEVRDKDYVVGPGDLLCIYLGSPSYFQVGPEGILSLPDVAPLRIGGLKLLETKTVIKKALASSYDTSKVHVTLASPNNFKIPLLGEVTNPGQKTVNSYTHVVELITSSGGFTKCSVRNRVRLVHGAGDTVDIPLANHYKEFREEDNPQLEFGDKVIVSRVDFAQPYCIVRMGTENYFHQLNDNSSLGAIFLQINNYSMASVPSHARVTHPGKSMEELRPEQIYSYVPQAGDTIEFKKEMDYVFVGGAVLKPGVIEYSPDFTPTDYIFLAGVTPQSADIGSYALVRDGHAVSPEDVRGTGVKPGDKIFLDRSKVDFTRDYLAIIASLASIVISSLTLYYTVH